MKNPRLLAKAKRFMVVTGVRYRIVSTLGQLASRLNGNKKADPKLIGKIDKEIMDKVAALYAHYLTEIELDEMIKFHSSPFAKKLRQIHEKIMKLTMQIACRELNKAIKE